MNTLNNIHALVDIDTGKAKSTIVELSKLMRYVLYEASNKTILLLREVQFLENYVTLMSLRYPEKVSIEKNFPLEVPEVQIPPLLFISIFRLLRINVYCSLCLSSTSSRIADSKAFVSLCCL